MRGILFARFLSLSLLSLGTNLYAKNSVEEYLPDQYWKSIRLNGNTLCADGSPFSFFTTKANFGTDEIVIDLPGGGACWNAETCEMNSGAYTVNIHEFISKYGSTLGVYDKSRDDNPIKNKNHIVVPYCTGDLLWGESDTTYTLSNGKSFLIRHRGAVNSKAVLSWIKEHYPNPKKITVISSSAGAYGAPYLIPYIAEMFPQAKILEFGDSAISPITHDFAKMAFKNWNIHKNVPGWIPGLDMPHDDVRWNQLQISYLYEKVAHHYPNIEFAHYTYAYDGFQRFIYDAMGGDMMEWPNIIQSTLLNLSKKINFKYFVGPGAEHVIIGFSPFYKLKATDGSSFQQWFKDFIDGKSVENKDCINCNDEFDTITEIKSHNSIEYKSEL